MMMEQMSAQLHWNMYKNLEREFLSFAEAVHINDKQVNVFSLKIAELLNRPQQKLNQSLKTCIVL